jgi:peptidoglycan/LPS O-acetylase OafA/YrhL
MEMSFKFLVVIFIVVIVSAYIRMKFMSSASELKCFDVKNTLPLRGVLALLIVGNHIGRTYGSSLFGFIFTFGAPIVAVFFFISGYGLMHSYLLRGGLNSFFHRRLSKILPLFLLLTCVAVFIEICLDGHSFQYEIAEWMSKGEPTLKFSWFIYAIILFYVIFYVACRIGKGSYWSLVLAYILSALYVVFIYNLEWGRMWYNKAFAFPIGMTVCMYEARIRSFIFNYKHFTLLTLLVFTYLYYILLSSIEFGVLESFVALVGIYAMGMVSNRVLRFLGKVSFEIYLFHGLLFGMLIRLNLVWWQFAILLYGATIFLSAVWHKLQQKIMAKQ